MKLFKTSLFLTLFVFLTGVVHAAEQAGSNMMQGDGMMGGWLIMVVLGLLLFIVLILGILALIKYLRSDKS